MVLIESNDPWNAYLMLFRYVKRDEIGGTSSQHSINWDSKTASCDLQRIFSLHSFQNDIINLFHQWIWRSNQRVTSCKDLRTIPKNVGWSLFDKFGFIIQKSFMSLKSWKHNEITILFIKMLIDNELFVLWYAH